MIELWILMAIALTLSWIHEHAYIGSKNKAISNHKISLVFIIMLLFLGGYLGLRVRGNDTRTYIIAYEQMSGFPQFWSTFDPSLSKDPGFNLVNAALKTLGVTTQSWLMIYALTTVGLYLHFFRKYKNDLVLNIYLFICIGLYGFVGAAIKQSLATAICLCALPLAEEKKWIGYILLVFLGSTFHMYALVYLAVPFLTFKPWTKKTVFLIVGTIVIAFSLQNLFGVIAEITSNTGEGYTVGELSGEGVNIFRILVSNVPMLLAFFFHKQLFEDSTRRENMMFNLSMINGCIMFIGLFGTANYFARLANYFVAAQAITLPWLIDKLNAKNRKFLKVTMVLCYLGYYYYSINIVYGLYSNRFERITIMEYLQQLF